jgi:hypothetical protein
LTKKNKKMSHFPETRHQSAKTQHQPCRGLLKVFHCSKYNSKRINGKLGMSSSEWSCQDLKTPTPNPSKLGLKSNYRETQRKEQQGRQTHISLTITHVQKMKEVIVIGSILNTKLLWFSKIHLHLVRNLF